MKLVNTLLNDVKIIENQTFQDERGSFLKVFNFGFDDLSEFKTVQINFVNSEKAFTLRGMHFQENCVESKFFRVLHGSILLGFIDLRSNSSTFTKSASIELTNPETAVLIPRGFATGYCTTMENTEVLYLSDNLYSTADELGIRWNDKILKIQWPNQKLTISDKDRSWPPFKLKKR